MRTLFILFLGIIVSTNCYCQEEEIKKLVSQGTSLHDQGKFDEAITKYLAALEVDKNSALANYELAYTFLVIEKYDDAVKYGKKAIQQKSDVHEMAYVVVGSALDMLGKPEKAIDTYEDGLSKFPTNNLLSYNLALTLYNVKDYDKSEAAAIQAILNKPTHASSHMLLSGIMKAKGQRVKSVLPLYYFLLLEPNSKRSKNNYLNLKNQLALGVEKKDEKNITITIPSSSTKDNEFSPADIMLSLLSAAGNTEKNETKSEMERFIEVNKSFFISLGELKKDHTGFWWDLYVDLFSDLAKAGQEETFSYYIAQSTNIESINNWIKENPDKMQKFENWFSKE